MRYVRERDWRCDRPVASLGKHYSSAPHADAFTYSYAECDAVAGFVGIAVSFAVGNVCLSDSEPLAESLVSGGVLIKRLIRCRLNIVRTAIDDHATMHPPGVFPRSDHSPARGQA